MFNKLYEFEGVKQSICVSKSATKTVEQDEFGSIAIELNGKRGLIKKDIKREKRWR
jgi:hypothetical protein